MEDPGILGLHEHHQTPEELELALANPLGLPRVLLMGHRRAGKTSVANVVFSKMSPHETLFLEPTQSVSVREIHTSELVHFQLIDFPGGFEFPATENSESPKTSDGKSQFPQEPSEAGEGGRGEAEEDFSIASVLTPEAVFRQAPSVHLVFVVDAQDSHQYTAAVEYFLCVAAVAKKHNPRLQCHVFIHKVDGDAYLNDDHKVEAQREIQQSIADELLEARLDIHPTFFLTSVYDQTIFEAMSKLVQGLLSELGPLESLLDRLHESCGMEKAFLFDVFSKIYVATDSNPVDAQTSELCSDMIDVVIDVSCIYGLSGPQSPHLHEGEEGDPDLQEQENQKQLGGDEMMAFDSESACVINLTNNLVLYLGQVHHFLALVCLMRQESFANAGIVEYNLNNFKQALQKLIDTRIQFQLKEVERSQDRFDKLKLKHLQLRSRDSPEEVDRAPGEGSSHPEENPADGSSRAPAGVADLNQAPLQSQPIPMTAPISMAQQRPSEPLQPPHQQRCRDR